MAENFTMRQERRIRGMVQEEVSTYFQWDHFRRYFERMNFNTMVTNLVSAQVGERVPTLVENLTRGSCERLVPGLVAKEMTTQFYPWLNNSGQVQRLLNTHLIETRNLMEKEQTKAVTEMQRTSQHLIEQVARSDEFNPIFTEVKNHAVKVAETATLNVCQKIQADHAKELETTRVQRDELVAELAKKTQTIDDLHSTVRRATWMSGVSLALGIGGAATSFFLSKR